MSQHSAEKILITVAIGGGFTIASFVPIAMPVWVASYALSAAGLLGVANSFNRRGESLLGGIRNLGVQSINSSVFAAIGEIVEDSKAGAEEVLSRGLKPASEFVNIAAIASGVLSAEELEARRLANAAISIKKPEHIAQVILGRDRQLSSVLLLAPPQSGKTTLLHYLVDYLIEREEETIVIVSDLDFGSSNDGVVSGWRGLPEWDDISRTRLPSGDFPQLGDCSTIITEPHELLTTLRNLRDIFHARRIKSKRLARLNLGGNKASRKPYPVIFLIVDEFQNSYEAFDQKEKDEVQAIMKMIMRSPKHRIAVLYAIHDTEATGGLNKVTLSKMAVVALGGAVQGICEGDDNYANVNARFTDDHKSALMARRKEWEPRLGAAVAAKTVATIDIKAPITTSDGCEHSGNCMIELPDFSSFVPHPLLPPEPEPEPEPEPTPEQVPSPAPVASMSQSPASVAKSQVSEILVVGLVPGTPEWIDHYGAKFFAWFTDNFDNFEGKTYSASKFQAISKHHGWAKTNRKTDDEYLFLTHLASQFQVDKPIELPKGQNGYIDVSAVIQALSEV
jgi:hypothetical protein